MMSSKFIELTIISFVSIICLVNGVPKKWTGDPAGYLSDCPNITIPIPKAELAYLQLNVRGANSLFRNRYNYFQAKNIAKDPTVDWSRKLVISVAGYVDGAELAYAGLIERAYLERGYNAILIETMAFAFHDFPIVARRIRIIAHHVAEMLAEVYHAGALDPANVEMVGLSLGAQTMGYIGKSFYQLTGKKIARLIGMDPTGPCFRNAGPDDRLDPTDGELVIVMHTNIDMMGMATPMGHVDFYVNGGEYQVSALPGAFCGAPCSHMRALTLWLAVVTKPEASFIGVRCNSVLQARFRECFDNKPMVTNELGFKTDKNKPGIYYLTTMNAFPYYVGKKGLKKEMDPRKILFKEIFSKKLA